MNALIDVSTVAEFNMKELIYIERESPLRMFNLKPEVYGTNSIGMLTSVMWKDEQKCSKCNGEGVEACHCCGHESECDNCDGEGVIHSAEVMVTRCDGSTIIKIINRDITKRILENGCEESDELTVSPDAWEVV